MMKYLRSLMLSTFVVSLVGTVPAVSFAESGPEASLEAFTTDACSMSPEGLAGHDWTHCCISHDIWYWLGGTEQTKKHADSELKACMRETLHTKGSPLYLLPGLYKWGTKRGGVPRYAGVSSPFPWRWGYGWSKNRGYAPLPGTTKSVITFRLRELASVLEDLKEHFDMTEEQLQYVQMKMEQISSFHLSNSPP